MTKVESSLLLAFITGISSPVLACPFCHTERGETLRRALFDERFGENIILVVLPFIILYAVVGLSHYRRSQAVSYQDEPL